MAYTLIELSTSDLDIFVLDNQYKVAHIASGGGDLPQMLLDSDRYNESLSFEYRNLTVKNEFEIEINPNISEITGLFGDGLNFYLEDFIFFAKQGLFSYDKTNLGNFGNFMFHLVARPKDQFRYFPYFFPNDILKINTKIPGNFEPFLLDKVFE